MNTVTTQNGRFFLQKTHPVRLVSVNSGKFYATSVTRQQSNNLKSVPPLRESQNEKNAVTARQNKKREKVLLSTTPAHGHDTPSARRGASGSWSPYRRDKALDRFTNSSSALSTSPTAARPPASSYHSITDSWRRRSSSVAVAAGPGVRGRARRRRECVPRNRRSHTPPSIAARKAGRRRRGRSRGTAA